MTTRHRQTFESGAARLGCSVPGCERPIHDHAAYLCELCTAHLIDDLRAAQWLPAELETTRLGQARLAAGGNGGAQPVPWVENASRAADRLANTITTWARFVSDERGIPITARLRPPLGPTCGSCDHRSCTAVRRLAQPSASPTTIAAGWLLATGSIEWLRHHRAGPEAAGEIRAHVQAARSAIDRAGDRWYAGRCGGESVTQLLIASVFGGPGECQAELYSAPTAELITCRSCGTEWRVPDRRAFLLRHAERYELTASELCRALGNLLGRELKVNTIRTWAHTKRLAERGRTDDGRPLYEVGDVITLVLAAPQRNRARQMITQGA